jgi:hypothetical protein
LEQLATHVGIGMVAIPTWVFQTRLGDEKLIGNN